MAVTTSTLSGNSHWPGSNALRDPFNVGTECTWNNPGSVAIKKGRNLFWQVDLGISYDISRIHLRGFKVGGSTGYSKNIQFSVCQEETANNCTDCGGLVTPPNDGWVSNSCAINGRYVRLLNANSEGRNWHFCRVFIYGFENGKFNKLYVYRFGIMILYEPRCEINVTELVNFRLIISRRPIEKER